MTDQARSEETVFLVAMQMATAQERVGLRAAGTAQTTRNSADASWNCLASHDASRGPLDLPPPGVGNPAALDQPLARMSRHADRSLQAARADWRRGHGRRVSWPTQREPIRRKVALKIIKPGMDTREVVTRFEAERQALALMDHPNIAKVLDGGDEPTRVDPTS